MVAPCRGKRRYGANPGGSRARAGRVPRQRPIAEGPHAVDPDRPVPTRRGAPVRGPPLRPLPGDVPSGARRCAATWSSPSTGIATPSTATPMPPSSWPRRAAEAVGRIAVMENRNFNAARDRRDAFFYFFESGDDPQVAAALIGAAADWARARRLDTLVGPKGFLPGDGLGILVEGFEHPVPMGVPYHHPYYDGLLTGCGLEKETDYLSRPPRARPHTLPERVPGSRRRRRGAVGLPPPPLHHQARVATLVRAHRRGLQPGLRRDLGVLPPHPGGDGLHRPPPAGRWPTPN